MSLTPQCETAIREMARQKVRELWGEHPVIDLAAIAPVIAPVWRRIEKARRETAQDGEEEAA